VSLLRGLFGSGRKRPAEQYVASLMKDPEVADVEWLSECATSRDTDRARWELRYLRRALGLLVAQRDALDDQTASSVARLLGRATAADRNVAAPMIKLAERQFNERLSAYHDMMGMRGTGDGPSERVARTLLLLSGATRMGAEDLGQATALVDRYLDEAAAHLRHAFGVASLPEGVPPPRG
jgi:hypothetical protein